MAGRWAKGFLDPLLKNKNFNTDRTLVVLTFDESENYFNSNQVYAALLGGAVSQKNGTRNSKKLNHYSLMKTVEDNWSLGDLGKKDAGAASFF